MNAWTFGRKLAAGFAVTVALTAIAGVVAIVALRTVAADAERLLAGEARNLIDAQSLETVIERKRVARYLLTGNQQDLDTLRTTHREAGAIIERLRRNASAETRPLIAAIVRIEREHQERAEAAADLRRQGADAAAINRAYDGLAAPRARLEDAVRVFVERTEADLSDARARADRDTSRAIWIVALIVLATVLVAGVFAFLLTGSLRRQIGSSVGQVHSSSAELQAAANQQVTSAREQATAMNEIATTIRELLVTSRQIAESAQRVAQIAQQTRTAAQLGETTVERGHESVASMRRHTDLVVGHMLELGRKSQQIGSVLDIVSELAEQTNILAINATIEAAGAGESGRRFGIVAEEIRKLADRVGGSAKEIRGLIDDVRSAVNTTVMTTESTSKAVDSGARQFSDVAGSFKQIAAAITTTTEAAREIELSTKQQSTAVEQVNSAMTSVAQATRESEASSAQTLQTASQLAGLSRDLQRLVQPVAH